MVEGIARLLCWKHCSRDSSNLVPFSEVANGGDYCDLQGDAHVAVPWAANRLIPQHSIAQNANALDLELDDVARFEEAHLLETATVADRA